MKKIETIIRPEKLEPVKEALNEMHIHGITVSPVMGCGNQLGWKETVRGTDTVLHVLPKVKLEIVVTDERVDEIVDRMIDVARTDEVGDGKIFISDVSDCIRIRTSERGSAAI